jgi:hypothetical protein
MINDKFVWEAVMNECKPNFNMNTGYDIMSESDRIFFIYFNLPVNDKETFVWILPYYK